MAKIISNIELLWDARNHSMGIIQVEITNWSYASIEKRYVATVVDSVCTTAVTVVNGTPQDVAIKKEISRKQVFYSKEEIGALFASLGTPVLLTDDYTSKQDELLSLALLVETQTNPIYESVAENWQLVTV